MGRIAHLRMTCPLCGKWTNVYVEETGTSTAPTKCEHCLKVFDFGAGMMYDPVAYVTEVPKWAVLKKSGEKSVPFGATQCKQCGRQYSESDLELDAALSTADTAGGMLDPSNPGYRKLIGLTTLVQCGSCGAVACTDCAEESSGIVLMKCPFCQTDYTMHSFMKPSAENVVAGSAPPAQDAVPAAANDKPKEGFFRRLFKR